MNPRIKALKDKKDGRGEQKLESTLDDRMSPLLGTNDKPKTDVTEQ